MFWKLKLNLEFQKLKLEFKMCLSIKLLREKGILFPEQFKNKKFLNNSRISRTVGHQLQSLF